MKKILVVDDTKNIRTLLKSCLEIRGYSVMLANNGKEALEILLNGENAFEAIFLDIRMPEISGTEVLKKIRSFNIECPVIIMTAFATVKNAIDCTKLGAVLYLQKPFSPERVEAALEEAKNSSLKQRDEELFKNAEELIEQGEYLKAKEIALELVKHNTLSKENYLLLAEISKKLNQLSDAEKYINIAKVIEG